jgi:AcrR family transcriptional regulator
LYGINIPLYLYFMRNKDPKKLEQIYEATLRLVTQNGLTGLTVAEISKEAKIGMSTIYGFFKSKEELINSLYKKLKQSHTNRIYLDTDPSISFVNNLKIIVKNYILNRIEYFDEHNFVEQCGNSHFLDDDSIKLDFETYIVINSFLDKGKQDFLVKPIENDLLIAQMIGAANEIVNLIKRKNLKLTEEITQQTFTLCWDSIKR